MTSNTSTAGPRKPEQAIRAGLGPSCMSWSLAGLVACIEGVGRPPLSRLEQGCRPTRQHGPGDVARRQHPRGGTGTGSPPCNKAPQAFWGHCQVQSRACGPRWHARSVPASQGSILVDGRIILQVGRRVALIPQAGAQPKGQRRAVCPTLHADRPLTWCLLSHQAVGLCT